MARKLDLIATYDAFRAQLVGWECELRMRGDTVTLYADISVGPNRNRYAFQASQSRVILAMHGMHPDRWAEHEARRGRAAFEREFPSVRPEVEGYADTIA